MSINRQLLLAFAFFMAIFGITHLASFQGSLIHLKDVTGGLQILDLAPEFTPEGVYRRLEAFGGAGRNEYLRTMLTIDIIFPISAFIFLFTLGRKAKLTASSPLYERFWGLIPLGYLAFDFIENAFIAILIVNYPTQLVGIASILGFISVLKRVLMILALIIPLALLVKHLILRRSVAD